MPEVHFIGELVGASGFDGERVYAKWRIESKSDKWRLLDGPNSGQTRISETATADGFGVWNEPLNLSFASSSLTGWPKLTLEVYRIVEEGIADLIGYGWCHMPTTPGEHTREIPIFAPKGATVVEELASYFLGISPQYEDPSVITSPESRTGHVVKSMGLVTLNVSVIGRMFPRNVIFSGGLC